MTERSRKAYDALTPEQRAKVDEAVRKNRLPEARAEHARVREILDREYRETGTFATDEYEKDKGE